MARRKTLDEVKATAEENHPGITSLLGTRTDSEVAEYYELSIQRVQSLRSQLNIPSFSKRTYSSKPGPQSLDQEEVIFLLENEKFLNSIFIKFNLSLLKFESSLFNSFNLNFC